MSDIPASLTGARPSDRRVRSNEELLFAAARALSGARPDAILDDLVAAAITLLQADAALVGLYEEHDGAGHISTLALHIGNERLPARG